MANATARVPMATVPWGDDKIERTTQSGTGTTYYPGQMMARINSSGLADHASDATGISFDGILAETDRVQVFAADTPGRPVKIERPWRFTMAIASAAAGDEGKAVYVVDNQTVGYSSSHSVLVGFVDQVLSSTLVLIIPLYSPLNPVAVSNNTLAFSGSTGANQITMPDNLADALSIAEGSNEYVTFITTDSSEAVLFKKKVRLDAINLSTDGTTGTKIGVATTEKWAFWNATPIVQPANTVDYVTMLTNLGLRATGGTAPATFPGLVSGLYVVFSGVASPTAFAASADDLAIGAVGIVRVTTDGNGPENLTGMVKTTNGQLVLICNIGTTDSIVIKHSATSSAANQFICPNSADVTLRKNGSVYAWYDSTSTKWRVMGA